MPRFLIVVVLFLAITLAIFSFSELQDITQTLRQAHPWFVALAILLQVCWLLAMGLVFRMLYGLLGLKETTERLIRLAAAAIFFGTVTTSASFGGLALLMADGRRRGLPSGKVTVAGALYLLVEEAAFLCVLAVGVIVLLRRNHLGPAEITASLIFLAIGVAIVFVLYLGYSAPTSLGNLLAGVSRIGNAVLRPFIHREYVSEERAHRFAADVSDGLGSVPEKPRSLIPPFLLALTNKILLMAVLVCSFLSFDVPFTAGTIVGGFVISYLFVIVTPTPSGVGVVEGVMAVALRTLGVDFSQAVIITLMYRGVTFWLPLAIGAFAWRSLHVSMARAAEVRT